MPNHVTVEISFIGSQKNIDKVKDLIKGENKVIDFEKIIPMPENIFRGNLGREEMKIYKENNWYDWSVKNWGTKWNAYYTEELNEKEIEFCTAWHFPFPIIEKLAKICADYNVDFDGIWDDEDYFNENHGRFSSINGEFEFEFTGPDLSKLEDDDEEVEE